MYRSFSPSVHPVRDRILGKRLTEITGDPTCNYILGKKLGSGSFGVVYSGVRLPKGSAKNVQENSRPIEINLESDGLIGYFWRNSSSNIFDVAKPNRKFDIVNSPEQVLLLEMDVPFTIRNTYKIIKIHKSCTKLREFPGRFIVP